MLTLFAVPEDALEEMSKISQPNANRHGTPRLPITADSLKEEILPDPPLHPLALLTLPTRQQKIERPSLNSKPSNEWQIDLRPSA